MPGKIMHNSKVYKYIEENGPVFIKSPTFSQYQYYVVYFISKKHPNCISMGDMETGEIHHNLYAWEITRIIGYVNKITSHEEVITEV